MWFVRFSRLVKTVDCFYHTNENDSSFEWFFESVSRSWQFLGYQSFDCRNRSIVPFNRKRGRAAACAHATLGRDNGRSDITGVAEHMVVRTTATAAARVRQRGAKSRPPSPLRRLSSARSGGVGHGLAITPGRRHSHLPPIIMTIPTIMCRARPIDRPIVPQSNSGRHQCFLNFSTWRNTEERYFFTRNP